MNTKFITFQSNGTPQSVIAPEAMDHGHVWQIIQHGNPGCTRIGAGFCSHNTEEVTCWGKSQSLQQDCNQTESEPVLKNLLFNTHPPHYIILDWCGMGDYPILMPEKSTENFKAGLKQTFPGITVRSEGTVRVADNELIVKQHANSQNTFKEDCYYLKKLLLPEF